MTELLFQVRHVTNSCWDEAALLPAALNCVSSWFTGQSISAGWYNNNNNNYNKSVAEKRWPISPIDSLEWTIFDWNTPLTDRKPELSISSYFLHMPSAAVHFSCETSSLKRITPIWTCQKSTKTFSSGPVGLHVSKHLAPHLHSFISSLFLTTRTTVSTKPGYLCFIWLHEPQQLYPWALSHERGGVYDWSHDKAADSRAAHFTNYIRQTWSSTHNPGWNNTAAGLWEWSRADCFVLIIVVLRCILMVYFIVTDYIWNMEEPHVWII